MQKLFTLIFIFSASQALWGQEAMRVERCSAIDPNLPVYNIHVDDDNNKWVSNEAGLWEVHAADLATQVIVGSAETCLLNLPGGNADIRWTKGSLSEETKGAISPDTRITAAYYNEIQDQLWIGTEYSGVYMFRTQPKLNWIDEITRRMPKFKSDKINVIYIDAEEDRHFIGTDQGIVVGKGGRWGLEERYFRFEAIAHHGSEVWLLAEDLIWVVDSEERWRSINLDLDKTEGKIKDIAFDRDGRLWIASQLLTMWDVENDTYRIFDGADYFTSNDVNCITVDKKGAVWVGTQDKGLYLIEKESAMTVTALAEKEVSCDPEINDGSLIVKINGGQPPYTYAWSDGLSGENPQNLAPGTYTVTVTDGRGISSVAEGELKDTRLKISVEQNQAADDRQKGGATATVEGGTPKYSYQWDNGEIGPSAANLEAGSHFVTVTDANGCEVTGSVEITREVGALAVQIQRTAESQCAGDQGNALLAQVNGGLGPYTYQWNQESLQGKEPTGMSGGSYRVTVTDAQGNRAEGAINIPVVEPLQLVAEVNSKADQSGANGKASAEASGCNGRYTFTWDNGETGARAKNLTAGLHTVTVTDGNGCTAEATIEIGQEFAELTATIEQTQASPCAGDHTNAIVASVSGGQAPYTYSWNNNSIESNQATNLEPGVYYLTVTDAQGDKVETSINIAAIEALVLDLQQNQPANLQGENGRAIVNVSGGTKPYTYQWDNGESASTAKNLSAGVHTVTITDANGCNIDGSVTIDQEIGELAVYLEQTTSSKCAGDGGNSMEARVTGGVEPYGLSWSNPNFNGNMIEAIEGGLYYLTVTDAEGSKAQSSINIPKIDPLIVTAFVEAAASTDQENGRARVEVQGGTSSYSYSWSNGESTANATNLAPGTHTVTVTDANGCTEQASVTIDENILALQTSLDITSNIACHGAGTGAIEASVAGGKGPFTYQWNEDALQGTQLSGLSGGTYSLTVTDAVGNQATASATIVEPELLQAEVIDIRGSTDESTNDGIASISVSGGTKPYSIAWDNGANTERVTNLSVGSHSVTITDAKGCEVSQDFEINKKILPQLTMSKLREGQLVQMQMLQFDADSTSINDGAKPILDEVYLFLKDNPGVVIRVEGHTNNIPPDEFCDNLSTARAKSVAEYIVQQGIAGERVYYRGYGKRQPRFSNLTPEGRRKNQRVEINIVSISDDS